MAGFADVIGQENVVSHLKSAIKLNKISHAYIVNGESGMGKKTIAKAFAMTLLCEKKGESPCMECHSCKQIMSKNHPDVKYVSHDKPATISVDDIRVQINNDIVIKPYSAEYKIYVVDEAQMMNIQAQNALLKTIEEPPSYGIVMLLVNNKDSFLQTILSRCVSLDLRPLSKNQIVSYLKAQEKLPEYQAEMAAVFSGGNLGRAIRLGTMSDFMELKTCVVRHLKSIGKSTVADVAACVKEIGDYKNNINEYLDLVMAWYRDVLIFKASKNIDELIFKEEILAIEKKAVHISYNGIQEIFMAIEKVKTRLRSNVNFDLTIELLLLTIKDNIQ